MNLACVPAPCAPMPGVFPGGLAPRPPFRATCRAAEVTASVAFAYQNVAGVSSTNRQRSTQAAIVALTGTSCPGRQAHATRVRWASPLATRARRRFVAASARRRSSSQRALLPRSGVSIPTRRYTAPLKRTVVAIDHVDWMPRDISANADPAALPRDISANVDPFALPRHKRPGGGEAEHDSSQRRESQGCVLMF